MKLSTKAANYAREKHKGQKDDCGKDYFASHIAPVANLLRFVTMDEEVIAAAYLHDTLEDTNTSYVDLLSEFGPRVASLVMEVTHEGAKDNYGYYFPRLKSKEGIMIKFADRLSNISRMENWSEARQKHYLKRSRFWRDKDHYKTFSINDGAACKGGK